MKERKFVSVSSIALNNEASSTLEPKSDIERLLALGFWEPLVMPDGEKVLAFILPAKGLNRGLQKIVDGILRYVNEMDYSGPYQLLPDHPTRSALLR
jgi:hypothetical protein